MKFFLECGSIPLSNRILYLKNIFFGILLVSLLAACSSHPLGPPEEGVMPEDRFVDLLIDVHYYEGVLEVSGPTSGYRPELRTDSIDFYRQVFDLHGVTREEFSKTMDYYSFNPPQFEAIYTRVVDELNKRLMEAEMVDDVENYVPPAIDSTDQSTD